MCTVCGCIHVYSMHILWKHEAGIDEDEAVPDADKHAVHANLAEAPNRQHTQRRAIVGWRARKGRSVAVVIRRIMHGQQLRTHRVCKAEPRWLTPSLRVITLEYRLRRPGGPVPMVWQQLVHHRHTLVCGRITGDADGSASGWGAPPRVCIANTQHWPVLHWCQHGAGCY